MKKYFFAMLIFSFFLGCKSYDFLEGCNIKSIHILYKEEKWNNTRIYKLFDGSIVEWDKDNFIIKKTLLKYQSNIDKFEEVEVESLKKYLYNKRISNYYPIKVVPLKEFGYIKTNKNAILFYGIMGDSTFIDLTNDKVYF